MPQTPHVERHFTASKNIRDIVIGMSDGLTVPFALAAGLLCLNYQLSDAHLRRLLAVDLEEASCVERWERINEVLLGRVPKPSADGSAGPC